jgi:hypothetical protein
LEPGEDDPKKWARKQFNKKTNCDDPDDWFFGSDWRQLSLASAPKRLKRLQNSEANFN